MKYNILFFGALGETSQGKQFTWESQVNQLHDLKDELTQKFPQLAGLTAAIAVNNQITPNNIILNDGDEIAFMPAFSGG